jgi:hypothetical protein
MDSHNVQRYVDAQGHARNEGDFQVTPGGPYPISYLSITPKASECTNLLVPVCLSSSHVAYGSIRMEPVFLILGQSAATAAVLAIDAGVEVQKVDYASLRKRMLADGQVLELPRSSKTALSAKSLPGVVVDDDAAELTGDWGTSSVASPYIGAGYRHDGDKDKGRKSATFRAKLEPGRYEVRVAYTALDNRAAGVPVVVRHAGGTDRLLVNQKVTPGSSSPFFAVGTFTFDGQATVEIRNEGTSGHVIVDAVQFLPVKP